MKVAKTYRKDCTLCWDVYIICICNALILSDYCVTIKNELHVTFASLESEVAECYVFLE
jgi:tRNA splicing ligase